MVCCFVCGSDQAKLSIYSKPTGNREPFFPFLDYQKPQTDTDKVESDDQYIVCNVCYAFLVQQWNTYEENGTPLSKRLYWMKHRKGQEHGDLMESFYDKKERSEDNQSIHNSFGFEDESNPASFQENSSSNCISDNESIVLMPKDWNENAKEWIENADEKNECNDDGENQIETKCKEERPCFICRQLMPLASLKPVHTKPQMRKEVPFYPSLVTLHTNAVFEIDSLGRFLACSKCNKKLLFQWHLSVQRGIPVSDRKYVLGENAISANKLACFICGRDDEPNMKDLRCMKTIEDGAYFPFLKNLREPPKAEPISSEGTVKCCKKCAINISDQWFDYAEKKVPLCDQVYIVGGKAGTSSKIDTAPVPDEKELVCLICQCTEIRKNMKEVYSNPYANMDLSFLEKIQKQPKSYFVRSSGQALVCLTCYNSLICQWEQFDLNNVPLDMREYKLHRHQRRYNKTICEICSTSMSESECFDTYLLPKEDDGKHPFFPCLARQIELSTAGRSKIQTCCFCSQNLILQWKHYERDCKTDDDRWKRSYKPHHFVCFFCSSAAHRSDIVLVHKNSCIPLNYLTQHQPPLLAVDFDGFIAVCYNCKELVDAVKTNGSANAFKMIQSGQRKIREEVGCYNFKLILLFISGEGGMKMA